MTSDQQAPFVIDAMTLRGIGSYLHGARLEFKPLTIICGANGSGKSTWLKTLDVLYQSLEGNRLPFGFSVADWDPRNIQLTNAFYHLADPQEFESLDNPEAYHLYGPPGTIGLEIHLAEDSWLPAEFEPDDDQSSPWNLLWAGLCKADSRIRLRVAHPTYWDDARPTPGLIHLIELQLDDTHVIRMEGERDPLQRFENGFDFPRRSKPYKLTCSRSFVSGTGGAELLSLATILDLNAPRCDLLQDEVDKRVVSLLLGNFGKRFWQLVKSALDGYFYIGAVRQPQTSLSFSTVDQNDCRKLVERRHVGIGGEHGWLFERCVGAETMRDITVPRFISDDIEPRVCRLALKSLVPESRTKLAHIWNRVPPEDRARVEAQCVSDSPAEDNQFKDLLAAVLNGILDDRGLFKRGLWSKGQEFLNASGDMVGYHEEIEDAEIRSLVESGLETLSTDDIRRLNMLLVLDAFADTTHNAAAFRQQCSFDVYLSSWLQRLVDIGIEVRMSFREDIRFNQWTPSIDHLYGILRYPTPFLISSPASLCESESESLSRLRHPCFGNGFFGTVQPPRQFSAGFHQIFPIVVQLGLMGRGELIGIENPEVHLHPSLQLRVTEMLLHHALSGRRLIVETHSDLVIRRVLRGVLEESISQSQVQIYFSALNQTAIAKEGVIPIEFLSSTIEAIRMDDRGRIANWPTGFLDEDVRESQRLMEIMYGPGPEEDDDDGPA